LDKAHKTIAAWLAIGVTILLTPVGCGPTYTVPPAGETSTVRRGEKVRAEAYLFDAKLRRHGKPTSFRLEVFRTDSVIALGGRAYLGKGALKGRLTADSMEIYFPSSNEYLYEPLSNLFATTPCADAAFFTNLPGLFTTLPDSMGSLNHVLLKADYSNPRRPTFTLTWPDCPWRLELTYDRRDTGWRLRRFAFNNGQDISLKARRREYKRRARVPARKFQLTVPADSRRISP
jgi:hypothetical protein